MGFPGSVKQEALVLSARRCCVCRQFKGVGIEVHHIKPQSEGGADTLDNAIALCFDCHAAAGHYNPEHPRGSRFGPRELRKHRAKHYAAVEAGHFPTVPSETAASIHIRHLVCLDYDQARSVLAANFQNEHFKINRLLQNKVSAFMERVLDDELPWPQGALTRLGLATPGSISVDGYWTDREALSAAFPEFATSDVRAIQSSDLESGIVANRLLAACLRDGMAPKDLGTLGVHHNFCGEEGWYIAYAVRRPLFVFTIIENVGRSHLTLAGLVGRTEEPRGVAPRPLSKVAGHIVEEGAPGVGLGPGETITLPIAVLLSPHAEDDLAFEWVDNFEVSHAEVEYVASTDPAARLDERSYLKVGPSFELQAMRVQSGVAVETIDGRPFDIRRVYLLGRGWLAGSCPHVVAELSDGGLVHLGEILEDAWRVTSTSLLQTPPQTRWLHICEFEFEVTTILQITIGGRSHEQGARTLRRGEFISVAVDGAQGIEVTGHYESALRGTESHDQARLKRSLVAGGLRVLRTRLLSPDDAWLAHRDLCAGRAEMT
jgi:hypothetical protein